LGGRETTPDPDAAGTGEAVFLTRRRGGAEEDAEKLKGREQDRDSCVVRVAEQAEIAEEKCPSFARMHKAEHYAT
jgi:hypothetical protein